MAMKTFMSIVLVIGVYPSLVSSERLLQEDEEEDEANGNSDSNDYYDENDGESTFVEEMTDLLDRVIQDVYAMWDASPSQWVTEYWEVFAGLSFVAFVVLSCLCLLFCIIPCCMDVPEGPKVMTKSELNDKQKKLLEATDIIDSVIPQQQRPVVDAKTTNLNQNREGDPVLQDRQSPTSKNAGNPKQQTTSAKGDEYHSLEPVVTAGLESKFSSNSGAPSSPTQKRGVFSMLGSWSKKKPDAPDSPNSTSGSPGTRKKKQPQEESYSFGEIVSVWKEFLGFQDEKTAEYYQQSRRRKRSKKKSPSLALSHDGANQIV